MSEANSPVVSPSEEPRVPVFIVTPPPGEVVMPVSDDISSPLPVRSASPVITGPSGTRRSSHLPVDTLSSSEQGIRKNAYRSASRRRRAETTVPAPVAQYQPIYLPSGGEAHLPHMDSRGQMGLYLPQNNSQNSSVRRDDPPVFRHARPATFVGRFKHQARLAWESMKTAYWHIEPWVIRPLVAGFVYNFGTQIARILLQNFLPSYFPKTVYQPLKADAQFYNQYNHNHAGAHDIPMLHEPPVLAITTESANI